MLRELHSIVEQYLEGSISLADMEDWLVPRLPILFHLPPMEPEATDLAADIEVGLAELSSGELSEGEFRNILRNLIAPVQVVYTEYPLGRSATYTGASNSTRWR